MKYIPRYTIIVCLLLIAVSTTWAQQPFSEGVLVYNIAIEQPGSTGNTLSGSFTCTIKAGQIRKDIQMNNGYSEVVIVNTNTNTAYSLQTIANKKYAVQLNLQEMAEKNKKYEGYNIQKETAATMQIAGQNAQKATITYKDGSTVEGYFTSAWYPTSDKIFDKLPGIKMIPLEFDISAEKGMKLHFKAEKIAPVPVENNKFRIPPEYKIITNEEYRKMRQQ